jgi:hypothetical protein
MELIAGSFLLVALSFFGHIGLVIASYLRRSKRSVSINLRHPVIRI